MTSIGDNMSVQAVNEDLRSQIAPTPVSKPLRHTLAVVNVKRNKFIIVRAQRRNLLRRLKRIKKKYDMSNLDMYNCKIWIDLPHAVDTANSVKKFLKDNGIKVKGRKQLIYWEEDVGKLYNIVEAYLNKNGGGTPVAMRNLGQSLLTDHFSKSGADSTPDETN
uniref:Uncharacterized protein n=1 Tax=Cuerna arida TaxID=1464854 RepID=A0A1B6GJZ7_9HEMI